MCKGSAADALKFKVLQQQDLHSSFGYGYGSFGTHIYGCFGIYTYAPKTALLLLKPPPKSFKRKTFWANVYGSFVTYIWLFWRICMALLAHA